MTLTADGGGGTGVNYIEVRAIVEIRVTVEVRSTVEGRATVEARVHCRSYGPLSK